MYRKMLLVLALSLVFAVALTACSKKQTAETPADDPEVTETPAPDPEPVVEEAALDTEPVDQVMMPSLEDVFFDYDSSKLSSSAKSALQSNATQLMDASSVAITIEGHCDERGTIAYNLALGEKRAKAAKDYLVSLGVPASYLKVISYGKERPFERGHSESSWSKNRRSHFVVSQN